MKPWCLSGGECGIGSPTAVVKEVSIWKTACIETPKNKREPSSQVIRDHYDYTSEGDEDV